MKRRWICTLALCAALLPSTGATLTPSNLGVPADETYVFLQSWGNEIGVFDSPRSIAIGGGRVYVCDAENHRIQVFDMHGVPLVIFGTFGTGDGQFHRPEDIAVDGSGNVYVADTYNQRIQKFTLN